MQSVCIFICLHPQRGSLSAQCVVLLTEQSSDKIFFSKVHRLSDVSLLLCFKLI